MTVTVNPSGVVTGCTGAGCGGILPAVDIHLQRPNVSGTVYESSGTPAPNTQVSANPQVGGSGTGTNTDMSGHYGLLLSPGTWNVTANAPSADTIDARTSVTVTVNTSGVVTKCTGAGCGGTPPTVDIHLQKANLWGPSTSERHTGGEHPGLRQPTARRVRHRDQHRHGRPLPALPLAGKLVRHRQLPNG